MKFAAPTLLAVFAVFGAGNADVTQSLSASIPHGFPEFAIVARIDGDGQRVTLYQNGRRTAGSTISSSNQSEIEARAYTIGGRQLKPIALQKRLTHNSVVLISTDGNFPSREYRQYLKPRTVVFVFHTGGLFPSQNSQYIRLKVVPGQAGKKS